MEILSFAFGMLAMVAIILIAIVVIGIVKVYKQDTRISEIHQYCNAINSDANRRMDDLNTRLDAQFESIHRSLDDLHREFDSKIEHLDSEMDSRFLDNEYDKGSRFDSATRYIDSRLDKLVSKLNITPGTAPEPTYNDFLQNNIKTKGQKEVLKG